MTQYVAKSIVVDVFVYKGKNDPTRPEWFDNAAREGVIQPFDSLHEVGCYVRTADGQMTCENGDYLVRFTDGSIYPYDPESFNNTYKVAGPEKFVSSKEIDRARLQLVQEADNGFVSIQSVIKEMTDLIRLFGV